jgi:hypothetical protein
MGLNSGTPDTIPQCDPASAKAADIKTLLEAIHNRLRSGLDDAWNGEREATALTGAVDPLVEPLRVANEAWAKQVAEMLTLLPYGAPSSTYAYSESKLVAAGLSDTIGNPYYPITAACQQLCSFALASRGMKFQNAAGGRFLRLLEAGSAVRRTWVDTMGGKWVTAENATDPKLLDGKPLPPPKPGAKPPPNPIDSFEPPNPALRQAPMLFKIHEIDPTVAFGPGSIFLYSNRQVRNSQETFVVTHADGKDYEYTIVANGRQEIWPVAPNGTTLKDNTAGAHLGFVLRADWATKTFQVFDTGGCQVREWSTGVQALADSSGGFHAGTFDGPTCTEVGAGADPFRGVGVLKFSSSAADQKTEADHIRNHVDNVLKKARPLGLARFVLLRRGVNVQMKDVSTFRQKDWLIYASPIMLTWEADEKDNYSIARYLWSLRDLPRSDEIQAMWILYVPRNELAAVMVEQGRRRSLRELLNDALRKLPKATQLLYARKVSQGIRIEGELLAIFTYPIANLTHRSDGSVYVSATYRKMNKMHPIHTLEGRWANAALSLDTAYLQGNQGDASFPTYFRPF